MRRSDVARYLYTVWFRDRCASLNDEDAEWPACFVVPAPTTADAKAWGDHLAQSFSKRSGVEEFLHSNVEPAGSNADRLLAVSVGYEASDGEIGW